MMTAHWLALVLALPHGGLGADGTASERAEGLAHARLALDRAVEALLVLQREDGRFSGSAPDCVFDLGFAAETYHAWQLASHALACLALAAAPPTREREHALLSAIDALAAEPLPGRGSDWDTDNVWTELYGFVASVQLSRDPERIGAKRAAALVRRGRELYRRLERHQALGGGWAYYDDPPYGQTWATSFCTALVLPSLVEARDRGWGVDGALIERALGYVRRCALPNGAFEYDVNALVRLSGVEHINRVEGSLGRMQVCNWALALCGDRKRGPDVLREGLEAFFLHHGFLDHVRTRPIPHEGFHSNAGYFYFFAHYYAARVIELLPLEERAAWHARLRPHLVKTLWTNGLTSDFLDAGYMVVSSTSFAILALAAGLDDTGE